MDLFWRYRSSKDMSASVPVDSPPANQQVKSSDREEKEDSPLANQQVKSSDSEQKEDDSVKDLLLHDADRDEGDLFEDAAAGLGQKHQQPAQDLDQKEQEATQRPAPVSSEQEELEDDDNLDQDDGGREAEEGIEDEDGQASRGSGESFDSAVDRIASADTSFDTPNSPKMSSPSDREIQSDPKSPKIEREEDAHSVEASTGSDELSEQPQSTMHKATPTAQDESDDNEEQFSQEDENGTLENGHEENQAAGVQDQSELVGREAFGSSDSAEKAPNAPTTSLPNSNGGLHSSEKAAAMPMDGTEERDDGELTADGQQEEDIQEPVEDTAGEGTQNENTPSKISAPPSDLDDSISPPHPDDRSTRLESEETVNNEEESLPAKLPVQKADEIQAKVSDDDAHSRSIDPGEQSASSDAPQVLPTHNGVHEGSSDGQPKDDTERLEHISGNPAVKGEEGSQIPTGENGEAEVESGVANLDDAEGVDVEDEDEEDADPEEEVELDSDGDIDRSKELTALLLAESSPGSGSGSAPSLGSAGPSLPARPTRVVRPSLPSLEPSARPAQQPRATHEMLRSLNTVEDTQANSEPDGNEEIREKLQSIRIKFLRLASRLGQSAHNVVVAQVLYRLGLAEQLRGGRNNRATTAFSFDRASSLAEEQERAGPEELDLACTIMMLGKTGVGKSATINSIFDEAKTGTSAFSPATNKVQVITGHVHGIKVRVIDTPGLLPSVVDQRHNEKILASVKSFIKKQSPDIVLYFDRLDMQSRDYGELPLLRTITDTFGAAVWFNAIVVLTHASSAPPDGPNGLPLSYEMFVAQRSHVVQQTIRQAAGDMRLMNPVSLVENHVACRVNRSGERVLPNGQVWKPQLLLLCFASKILAEANSLLKLQDNTPGRPFGQRSRLPPLPFLLSSLLQSRAPLKLPDEQGDEDESDEELEEDDDSEDEEDYDQLPPFRRLAREEIAELDEVNRGEYFEELAERERLFQKKQWKEELKRRRETKKRMEAEASTDQPQYGDEGLEEDMARAAAVPVPMPDMVLPPSFDSDNPSHRYRYLETANQWLVRPVLETHGWDHDNGYDGMNVEKLFVIGDKIPTSVSGQITKDKKDANLNMEAAASLKHGEGKVTMAGLDVQTVGKDLAYTLRSETRFSNFRGNKTTGGLAVTLLGDTLSAGMKIEDRLLVGRRVKLVVNGGAITGGSDVAYGGSLEATVRDKEYPLSRTLSTLGVSVMDWHGDLAVGGNLQSQFILGKTMMVGRANINNRGAGQISIRASSSEQLQMALIGILPIVRAIVNRLFGESQQ